MGGFTRSDIEGLLETLENNFLGWSSTMAPAIMGAPEQRELGQGSQSIRDVHRSPRRSQPRANTSSEHRLATAFMLRQFDPAMTP